MTTVAIVALSVVAAALAVNLVVLRRRFAPLESLIEEMEKVDLSTPGPLLPASIDGVGETEEVERIELAFLRMMRRLEAERRRAGSAALQAQEQERARVARDLHDEVNQSLTGLLLRLEAAREEAPPDLEAELAETKALANQAMRELLSLARQLRPTALDDLGLAAAIGGQVEQLARGEIEAELAVEGDFSGLDVRSSWRDRAIHQDDDQPPFLVGDAIGCDVGSHLTRPHGVARIPARELDWRERSNAGGNAVVEQILSGTLDAPADYNQRQDEWVVVLRGKATLEFEGGELVRMQEGDYVTIQRHVRHRVQQTDPKTIWLAVHIRA